MTGGGSLPAFPAREGVVGPAGPARGGRFALARRGCEIEELPSTPELAHPRLGGSDDE
jgi:hypothetical protein